MHYDLRTKPFHEALKLCEKVGDTTVIVYEPGNGTRYVLLLSRIGAFSFSSQARDAVGLGSSMGYVVSFPEESRYRTLVYTDGSYLAPNYLREKVGCSISDAVVLGELLAYQTDCQAPTCAEFQKEHDDE